MRCLVIIPMNMHRYSFSGPLAWLFAKHADRVRGVYSEELTAALVRSVDHFFIELNWFTQLEEFLLVVRYVRRHNPSAKIVFGGLFATLEYREIFSIAEVDYFVKGDNEVPLDLYLSGTDPRTIPNLIGRGFENDFSYQFSAGDFDGLEFSLSWFPSYRAWVAEVGKRPTADLYRAGTIAYFLPMLFSTKSGCLARHAGCDYCMGSRLDVFRERYRRDVLTVSNRQMIGMLRKVEAISPVVSIMMMSEPDYDFRGEHFDLEATIEFDSRVTFAQLERIVPAFRETNVHVAVYEEGLTGETRRGDLERILGLSSEAHRFYFFSWDRDKDALAGVPPERVLPSEIVLPRYTDFDAYQDLGMAQALSREIFASLTGCKSTFLLPGVGARFKDFLVQQGVAAGTRAVVRADTAGFLEILAGELGGYLELVGQGTGEVGRDDLALAASADAMVIGYNVGVAPEATVSSAAARLLLVRPLLNPYGEEYYFARPRE